MEKLKIGTVFSGIGALEHAFKRMEIPYEIQFACDTGDVDIFSRKMEGTYQDTKKAFDEMRKEIVTFISETEEDKEFIIKLEDEVISLWSEFSKLPKDVTKSSIRKIKELLSMSFEKLNTQKIRQKLRHIENYKDKKKFVDNLYKSKEKNNKVKQTYMANYPITEEQWHYNVCFMDGREWKDKIDIFMGGSPCFTGNTLVLTKDGYKFIKDINIGDEVLSHDKMFHKVLNVMNQGLKEIYVIKSIGFDEIETTKNHKFYIKKKHELPQWKEINSIQSDYKDLYVGTCVNTNELMPKASYGDLEVYTDEICFSLEQSSFWKTLGYYFGDFTLGASCLFFELFGEGYKKKIPSFMFDLPVKYLHPFLDGLLESESSISIDNGYEIHISDRKVAYSISCLIGKTYHFLPEIEYKNGEFIISINDYVKNVSFYEDGYIWCPIKYITKSFEIKEVFDIEVENSHSFLANNCIVHNCQSFSAVGKRRGLEDTRGTLFFEFARLISEIHPKVFLYENVKGLLTHDKGNTWKIIQEVFDSLGYNYHYQILDAKDYGIPQNRKRVFVVGFRKDLELKQEFKFPEKIPLTLKMQDFLLDNVLGRYYLTKNQVKFVNNKERIEKGYVSIDAEIALCQLKHQQFNLAGNFVFVEENKDMEKTMKELDKYFLSEKLIRYVMDEKNIFWIEPETDKEIASTLLKTMHKMHRAGVDNYVHTEGRLRKLTPRECFRLMGFCDSYIIPVTDTAAYMQAGNSIVVDVLIHLLNEIFKCVEL